MADGGCPEEEAASLRFGRRRQPTRRFGAGTAESLLARSGRGDVEDAASAARFQLKLRTILMSSRAASDR